ncbi:hypothetical protein [Xanthobacter versatilis]|uniref:hypothetical protein n=1 Tax=Xanthobacter autotrophicus (strain ATCC BAA-1158 / Py2) TaxID=78245 RepID=UPI003726E18A
MKWGYFNEFGEIAGPFDTRELAEENAAAELGYAGDALDIVQIVTVARVVLKPVAEEKAATLAEPDTIELVTVEEEPA